VRKRPDSRIVPTRLAQKTLVVIVYDLDLFMTNPGLFCSKETGSSRIIHTPGRLSRIIRAVFVIYLELFVTTPGLFLRERTQKFWNCSCPTLANDSGCYCLWFGIVHDNSRSFMCKRNQQVSNCSCPILWNYSGCHCS